MNYLHREEARQAVVYAMKSLATLNATKNFCSALHQKPTKIPCGIARHKVTLGQVYSCLWKYNEAMRRGFKEAEYIIENSLDSCSHNLLKAQILLGIGEIFLRTGKLKEAENKLTQAIFIQERLVGGFDTLRGRIYRAEARIRLGKLTEAYEDCLFVLNLGQKIKNNYFDLIHLMCLYHAAVIKHKEGDIKNTLAHFANFFRKIEPFCKTFLDAEPYNALKLAGMFNDSSNINNKNKDPVTQFLYQSLIVFSEIFDDSHPFVHEYVLQNYNSIKNVRH